MKKLTLTTRSRDKEFASLVGKVVSIKSGRYITAGVVKKVQCFRNADEKSRKGKDATIILDLFIHDKIEILSISKGNPLVIHVLD